MLQLPLGLGIDMIKLLLQSRRTNIRLSDDVGWTVWRPLGAYRGKSKMAHQRPNARRLKWVAAEPMGDLGRSHTTKAWRGGLCIGLI